MSVDEFPSEPKETLGKPRKKGHKFAIESDFLKGDVTDEQISKRRQDIKNYQAYSASMEEACAINRLN